MHEHRPNLAWSEGGAIVPGTSIGNFVLGRTAAELLGPDAKASLAEYSIRCNVRIQLEKGRIVDLSTSSGRFETAEGFKVGSPFADMVAAWGEPPEVASVEGEGRFEFKAAWPDRGVDVAVHEGNIVHIGVFPIDGTAP